METAVNETAQTQSKPVDTPVAPVAAEAAPVEPTQETTPETAQEIKYELTLPEKSKLSQDRLDEIAAYAREQGLSNEVAQEIVNRENGAIAKFEADQAAQFSAARAKWVADLKSDKTYGGDNFNKTVTLARRFTDRFATPELKEALKRTGMGDHKELIITLANAMEQMSDDTLITSQVKVASQKRDPAEVLYGGMNKE